MRTLIHWLCLIGALICLFVAGFHARGALGDEAPNRCETNMVGCINRERANYGLPALELDATLLEGTRQHCAWMTRTRRLEHATAPVTENIACGQATNGEVVKDWMQSPGHRRNILGFFTRVAATGYTGPDGRSYWCARFASSGGCANGRCRGPQ